MKARPARRRALALAVVLAIGLDLAVFLAKGYERLAREHVVVKVAVEHQIVQVFVDCQLAHPAYEGLPYESVSLDLGWLAPNDIVTFQVRGRKLVGYYGISLEHGFRSELVKRVASFGHPRRFPSGRLIFEGSYTAAGLPLEEAGCQSDSSHRLAFAAQAARGPWSGGSGWALELADALSPVFPWALALLGAAGLTFVSVRGRIRRSRVAVGLGALIDLALAASFALASRHFGVVFTLWVAAGSLSLLALLAWLAHDDPLVHRLKRSAGGGGRPRIEGGEGATTADGI